MDQRVKHYLDGYVAGVRARRANRERAYPDYEAAKIPVLDTLAMSWHKFLRISHDEAMEREDFNEMAELVTRAAVDAAIGDRLLINPPTEEER